MSRSFSVSIYATSQTQAHLDGSFTDGDASYPGYRYIKLTVGGVTLPYLASENMGGADSYWDYDISGLSPDTTYAWSAELYYAVGTEHLEYISTGLTDSGTFHTDAPPTYSVRAVKSTLSGDGIATVSVSASEVEAGTSVRFSATLNPGYIFLAWATVDGTPSAQDIVSTDREFWYRVYDDTTLYAYAGLPPSGVHLYTTKNGEWRPTLLYAVKTLRWQQANLACVEGDEWKS